MATARGNGTTSISYDAEGRWQVCVKNDRDVGSFGIFFGDNPFDFTLPATLFQLFIVTVFSQALYSLLKPLRTPKFICSVIAGILLGPSFLGQSETYWQALFPPRQAGVLTMMSLVGAIYFLFSIALKMDSIMTIRAAKSTWRLGVIPFLASYVTVSSLLSLVYCPQNFPHLQLPVSRSALSATISYSNFPVVSDALHELNLMATELGQIALSSATLNDCIQVSVIVTHHLLDTAKVMHIISASIVWFSFILFSIFVLRPLMRFVARITPIGEPVKQIYVVFILAGVLVMAGLTDTIGVTFLIGPLIYGLVIPSGPPLGSTLVEKSDVVIQEILLPFFFIYVGMNVNINALKNWRAFITLQLIIIAGDLAKILATMLVSMTYNIKAKHGVVLGLMMNIRGITHLIAFSKLKKLKLLDDDIFSQLVICVVITTAIITPLVKKLYRHRPRVRNSPNTYDEQMRTIQNSPRDSEFRIITCVHHEGNVRSLTGMLEACNPIRESPLSVYVIHLIPLLGKSSPIMLPINYRENKKFLSVNYPNTHHIMRAFENYASNSRGPVTVLPYINVSPYKSMHDAVCNLAQDKMVPFVVIPFHENGNVNLTSDDSTSVRKLNSRFQECVPCSLGILVDRNSRLGSANDYSKPYFHVGIFFIGGADDREALALGIRMSEQSNMKVSLFRFVVFNKRPPRGGVENQSHGEELTEEEEEEDMFDEGLIDEFKSMQFASGNVSWYEIMVEDVVEVMDAIRGLEGNYDLVMVGKRHSVGYLNDDEMGNFIENAEVLGIFGDMLSSTEFCIGMVPVLVTQCGGDKIIRKLDRLGSVNASQRSLGVDKVMYSVVL